MKILLTVNYQFTLKYLYPVKLYSVHMNCNFQCESNVDIIMFTYSRMFNS